MKPLLLILTVLATGGPTPSPGVQRVTGRAPIYSDGGLTPQVGIVGISSTSICPSGSALTVDGGALYCHANLAGGQHPQIQYNNSGALAGVFNATSNGVVMIFGSDAGSQTNPDAGFKLFGRQYTQWTEATAMSTTGNEYPLQDALWAGQHTMWSPSGTTSVNCVGACSAGVATTSGTITTPAPTHSDDWTYRPRWRMATAGTANASAYATQTGSTTGVGFVTMGDAANRGGGFFYADCNAAPAVVPNARALIGFREEIGSLNMLTDPVNILNTAYFGFDSTDTVWEFCTNDDLGVATCDSTGFAIRDAGTGYSFRIQFAPNGTAIDWRASNDQSGAEVFGSKTTNLPTDLALLAGIVQVNNGATAAVTYIECSKVFWRSDH